MKEDVKFRVISQSMNKVGILQSLLHCMLKQIQPES